MESATPGVKSTRDGWLNRYLQVSSAERNPLRGVALARHDAAVAAGAGAGAGIGSVDEFGVRGTRRSAFERSIRAVRPIASCSRAARTTRSRPCGRCDRQPASVSPRRGRRLSAIAFRKALQEIARLAKADVGLEVAFTELGNWDHHVNEGAVTGQIATPARRILARPRGAGGRPRRSPGGHGHRHDVGVRPRRRGERQWRHRPWPRQRDDGDRRQRATVAVHGTWPGLAAMRTASKGATWR